MRWFVSECALHAADVGRELRKAFSELVSTEQSGNGPAGSGSVCVLASDLIRGRVLPSWVDVDTVFLVVLDVPVAASMRIPTLLRVHKPDQRVFVTTDLRSVHRWMLGPLRDRPFAGVVDAYVLDGILTLFLGDSTIRSFPVDQVPSLASTPSDRLSDFEIDADGSFLYWPAHDVHLSGSQLLQAVSPSELADIETERYRVENTAVALKHMRESRGLRQVDIGGLSERQVSRLENGRSRLTADAARKWADALGLELPMFLKELGELLTYWTDSGADGSDDRVAEARTAAVT